MEMLTWYAHFSAVNLVERPSQTRVGRGHGCGVADF